MYIVPQVRCTILELDGLDFDFNCYNEKCLNK